MSFGVDLPENRIVDKDGRELMDEGFTPEQLLELTLFSNRYGPFQLEFDEEDIPNRAGSDSFSIGPTASEVITVGPYSMDTGLSDPLLGAKGAFNQHILSGRMSAEDAAIGYVSFFMKLMTVK